MTTARVTSKGQVVIPAGIRRRLGIRKGTQLIVEEQGDGILLRPANEEYFDKIAGVLKGRPSLTRKLLAERAKDRLREER